MKILIPPPILIQNQSQNKFLEKKAKKRLTLTWRKRESWKYLLNHLEKLDKTFLFKRDTYVYFSDCFPVLEKKPKLEKKEELKQELEEDLSNWQKDNFEEEAVEEEAEEDLKSEKDLKEEEWDKCAQGVSRSNRIYIT